IAAGADDRLLYAAVAFGDDISLVRAFVEAAIRRVARHQVRLNLRDVAVFVGELVEARGRLLDVLLLLALHALAHLRGHLLSNLLAGVLADVGDDDGRLARRDLLRRLK